MRRANWHLMCGTRAKQGVPGTAVSLSSFDQGKPAVQCPQSNDIKHGPEARCIFGNILRKLKCCMSTFTRSCSSRAAYASLGKLAEVAVKADKVAVRVLAS